MSTNSFCWTAGTSSSYGAPGIIHKLAAHLLHLASATRPWHCLPKGPSVRGAVAATVSLKHHLLLHLCSHLTAKYNTNRKRKKDRVENAAEIWVLSYMSIYTITRLLAVSVAEGAVAAYRVLEEREVCTMEVDMAKNPSRVEQGTAEN